MQKHCLCRKFLEFFWEVTLNVHMAQGLYLKQQMSLQQVLAPQLQQSLALLQAPTLELKALVEQELQQNPVLEEIVAEEMELATKAKSDGDTADLRQRITRLNPSAGIIECMHHPLYLEDVFTGQRVELRTLKGRRVASLSGIAQPESFEQSLVQLAERILLLKRNSSRVPSKYLGPLPVMLPSS